MSKHTVGAAKSGMAIAGLILGIIALITAWMPILNNISFFIALIGVVLAIVGMISTLRGKYSGKVFAIIAVIINVVAMVAVLAAQSATSAALNEAVNGSSVSSVSTSSSTENTTAASESADQSTSTDLTVGTSVKLDSGLSIVVNSVDTTLTNYDGSSVVGVSVTYVNNGSDSVSYNMYDWKGEDSNGAQEDATYYSNSSANSDDALQSGTLAVGGTKSGMLYFKADTVKVLYFSSLLNNDAAASWDIA